MIRRILVTTIALSTMVLVTNGETSQAALEALPQSPPKVCQDESGRSLTGDLDVLTILDNSSSLSASDPDGKRFDAIEEFLSSYAKTKSSQKKNFGLIKFGGAASQTVPLQDVNEENWQSIVEDVRLKIPNTKKKQEKYTNYVKALELALDVFRSRPAINCKVLIWFTDGIYDTTNDSDDDTSDARELRGSVCSNDGLSAQIQASNVSTFVIYLTPEKNPEKDKDNAERASASKDAMQAITGDEQPSFDETGSATRKPTSECKLGAHLGEVLSAADAGQLLGYLVDLVEVANGGQRIFESDCPFIASEVESVKMPSPYFLDWLSITTWKTSLPQKDNLRIRTKAGEQKFADVFVADTSSGTDKSIHYLPRPEAMSTLSPGWTLVVKDSDDLCIRARARNLEFQIQQKEPREKATVPDDLPVELFEGKLTYFDENLAPLTIKEALGRSQVVGQLSVEYGEILAKDGLLPVQVSVDGAVRLEPIECGLSVDYLRKELHGKRLTSLNGCQVVPSSNMSTLIDASAALSALEKECELGPWQLELNGQPGPLSVELPAGAPDTDVRIGTVELVPNEKKKCSLSDLQIEVQSAEQNLGISLRVSVDLLKRAGPLWPLLALLFIFAAVALSLGLLRLVNVLTARAPKRDDFFGYVTSAEILSGDLGRASIRWSDQSTEFKADPKRLEVARGDDSRTSIGVGEYRFVRQLPRIIRPFEEARLVLQSERSGVFWRANSAKDGLTISFSSALAVIAKGDRAPSQDRGTSVDVVVLVPKRGVNSGFEGVERLVRQRIGDLVPQLVELLKQRESEALKASKEQEAADEAKSRTSKSDLPSSKSGPSSSTQPPIGTPPGKPPTGDLRSPEPPSRGSSSSSQPQSGRTDDARPPTPRGPSGPPPGPPSQ